MYEPSEDTALLLRALETCEPDVTGLRALDVGTGSGAIAFALVGRGADVVAVDISPLAAEYARGVIGPRVARGDLASALKGPFDIVTFNAPYLPSSEEERVQGWLDHAFHGGEGGVEVSARFVRDMSRVLAPGGRVYLVVSSRADLDTLRAVVAETGLVVEVVAAERFFFEEVAVWRLSPPNA